MSSCWPVRISAVLAAVGVGLGAFGAHGLQGLLRSNSTSDTWETAVLYHLVHAVGLLALSFRYDKAKGPWLCLVFGILVFSGTLYTLAITNIRWLGAITPIGGVAFIAGWIWLAVKPPLDHG